MALASEDGLLATEDGFLTSIPRDPDPGLGPNPDPIPIPRDWGNPDPVGTLLIWYWHEAQCPGSVLVRVLFRLVASGPSYGRFKGQRSKNGQKWPKFFSK